MINLNGLELKLLKRKISISPQWLRNIKAKNYPKWRPDIFFSKKIILAFKIY